MNYYQKKMIAVLPTGSQHAGSHDGRAFCVTQPLFHHRHHHEMVVVVGRPNSKGQRAAAGSGRRAAAGSEADVRDLAGGPMSGIWLAALMSGKKKNPGHQGSKP